ncbi:MAG: PH domain-containing protein [Acidobacteriota bacterium]
MNEVPEPEWRSLDPRVVAYWRLKACLGWAVLLAGVGIGGGFLWALTPAPRLLLLALVAVATTWAGLEIFWLPRRRYRAFGYRLHEAFFELRHGIFWRRSVMIPIRRIQHVDFLEGPWERRLRLARLQIYTAGTKSASHELPGLERETALQLRRELILAAGHEAT